MSNILAHPQFDSIASQYESSLGLPTGLLRSVAIQESGGRNIPAANGDGGMGVFQFTDPSVIKYYNVDPKDPWDSLRAAAEYLGDGVKKYGSTEAALADFHRGPKAAQRVAGGGSIGSGPIESKYIPEVMGRLPKKTEQAVAAAGARGDTAAQQVAELRKGGFNEWIDDALNKGASYDEIVSTLAPEAQKRGADARAQKESDGFVVSTGKRVVDNVQDLTLGARQIYNDATGDTETSTTLKGAVAANRADPNRIARDTGASGVVGDLLTYAPLAAVPGGVVAQGVAGATVGALAPTAEGESRLGNAASGAAFLGGAAGATKVLGKALGASSKIGGSADDIARAEFLAKEGITVPRSMSSDLANKATQTANAVPGARLLVKDAEQEIQKQAQAAIARRAGVEGVEFGSDAVIAAENNMRQLYAKALGDTVVEVPENLRTSLLSGLRKQVDDANPLIRREMMTEFGDDIARLEAGTSISANSLNRMKQTLGADGRASSLSAAEKQAYVRTRQAVSDALEEGLPPEQLAMLNKANDQYRNVTVMKDVVSKMKDDPNKDVIKALEQAVTAVKNKGEVVHGKATMQDLQKALSGLHRNKGTLNDIAGGSTAGILGALATVHTGGLASISANMALRFLNSPAGRAEMQKLPPNIQAAIAKKAMSVTIGANLNT